MINMRGFTLLETLLSVALLSMVFILTIPLSQTVLYSNDLEQSTQISIRAIRTAQSLSQSSLNDSTWGVRFSSGQITVFQGASYAARVSASDREYDVSTNTSFGGTTEIIFNKIYGEPNITGTLSINNRNKSENLVINEKGNLTK
jgi:type II secretory pathway pseudopilin PulG